MLISNKEKILNPPKSYFIELTNHCNLTCTMCNFHSPVERTDTQGKRFYGYQPRERTH